jgi:tRNA(fMet)-specific endonuclease VapC
MLSDLALNPQGLVRQKLSLMGFEDACTSIICAGEARFGVSKQPNAVSAEIIMGVLDRIRILPFEEPADKIYGKLRAELERKGQLIGANDILIAAHALAEGLILVTANTREFSRVEGLKVENWLA